MAKPLAAILKPRLKAGGIHFLGSLLIASLAAALVFLVWYPAPLAEAQGVDSILVLLIIVDVIIGPMVTTLIFNPAKRLLKFDMTIVVMLQLIAMLYGLYTIFAGRPAFITFNVDRFDIVAASDIDRKGLGIARQQGKAGLPWFGPQIDAAVFPSDPRRKMEIMFSGSDLPQLMQWHVQYADAKDLIMRRVHPLLELKQENGMSDAAWQDFLSSLGADPKELGYLALRARAKDGAVIVNAKTTDIIKIVLLNPRWK